MDRGKSAFWYIWVWFSKALKVIISCYLITWLWGFTASFLLCSPAVSERIRQASLGWIHLATSWRQLKTTFYSWLPSEKRSVGQADLDKG